MRSGKLNRRLTIQQPGPARDAAGQPSTGWVNVDGGTGEVWADILYLNGRQYATSNAEASSATVSIRVRYRTDLNATMRVVYGATIFDILAVLPDEEDRDHVDLACSTGVNSG
jgi:SPP1 family predicted phage head-tail adaptor